MIVAGEASGDLHGSGLVREALRIDPGLSFFGIGGPRMREVGVRTLVDAADMAVVGLVEVLAHFPVIYRAYRTLTTILRHEPPDLLILIDYPDFNLRLAKVAKRRGVKVLYYISPQIWAWRTGRVHQIARLVNAMAVVFPFEVPFYKRARVPVQFVGHPLRDTAASELSRDEAVRSFGLDPTRLVVGLFPGSRRGEVARLFPLILETGRLLRQQFPAAQFLLPRASSLTPEDLAPHLAAAGLPVVVVDERVYDVIRACDAIVTVSGTVTLEIALVGTPMVIIYRVSPLTYAIGKRVVKVDHIGLCNIVAGARVVPELIQDAAQPAAIAREVARFLTDPAAAGEVRSQLATVRQRLGEGGAAARVARLALDLLAAKA